MPVIVFSGDEAAIRSGERAYLAAGLPPIPRAIHVRVAAAPGIFPPVLPATFPDGSPTAAPGDYGGTWISSGTGDVDLAEEASAPHELLHAALFLGGRWPDGDRAHRDPLWAAHRDLLRVR